MTRPAPARSPWCRATSAATYRVRGYVSALVERDKTTFAWVWDVYDTDKRRALRLSGEEPAAAIRRRGARPGTALGRRGLDRRRRAGAPPHGAERHGTDGRLPQWQRAAAGGRAAAGTVPGDAGFKARRFAGGRRHLPAVRRAVRAGAAPAPIPAAASEPDDPSPAELDKPAKSPPNRRRPAMRARRPSPPPPTAARPGPDRRPAWKNPGQQNARIAWDRGGLVNPRRAAGYTLAGALQGVGNGGEERSDQARRRQLQPQARRSDRGLSRHHPGAGHGPAFRRHGDLRRDPRERPRLRRVRGPVDLVPGQRPPDGASDHHRRAAPLLGAPHHRGDPLFRLRPAGPQSPAPARRSRPSSSPT